MAQFTITIADLLVTKYQQITGDTITNAYLRPMVLAALRSRAIIAADHRRRPGGDPRRQLKERRVVIVSMHKLGKTLLDLGDGCWRSQRLERAFDH